MSVYRDFPLPPDWLQAIQSGLQQVMPENQHKHYTFAQNDDVLNHLWQLAYDTVDEDGTRNEYANAYNVLRAQMNWCRTYTYHHPEAQLPYSYCPPATEPLLIQEITFVADYMMDNWFDWRQCVDQTRMESARPHLHTNDRQQQLRESLLTRRC